MSPELNTKQPIRVERGEPHARIPELVRQSVIDNPKKAKVRRRARLELFQILKEDPYLNPTLIAVLETQEQILSSRNMPRGRQLSVLLEDIAKGVIDRTEVKLKLDDDVKEVLRQITKNDNELRQQHMLSNSFPHHSYDELSEMAPTLESRMSAVDSSVKEAIIRFHKISHGEDKDKLRGEVEAYDQWKLSVIRNLNNIGHEGKDARKDELIGLLKNEPKSPFPERQRIWEREYGGLSLSAVTEMEHDVFLNRFGEVIDYATEALSEKKANITADLGLDKDIVTTLFLTPTHFYTLLEKFDFQNENLLRNFNFWQETLAFFILRGTGDKMIDQQLTKLLKVMPEGSLHGLMFTAANPPDEPKPKIIERKSSGLSVVEFQNLDLHPVWRMAFEDGRKKGKFKDSKGVQAYSDEIGMEYYYTGLVPKLEERLRELGMHDKFAQDLEGMRKFAKEHPYSDLHLNVVKQIFEATVGGEFLKKLSTHSDDIKEISKIVWKDATEEMHFLPAEELDNILDFSEGSIPNTLGLKSLMLVRTGSPKDWRINLSFIFHNTTFALHGMLDQDGKMTTKTDLENQIPGLHALLKHIATLVFHDLVIQVKKEKRDEPTAEEKPKSPIDFIKRWLGHEEPDQKNARSLPRTQKDADLISEIYTKTGYVPRKVDLYKRSLARIREYVAAIELYNEAKQRNASFEELEWITKQLREAAKKANKISSEKKLNVPTKFRLSTIRDPLTGEERYLETWVIDHGSPKFTSEELLSPVKVFEHYYRKSSALASLNQMKPWIVGQ